MGYLASLIVCTLLVRDSAAFINSNGAHETSRRAPTVQPQFRSLQGQVIEAQKHLSRRRPLHRVTSPSSARHSLLLMQQYGSDGVSAQQLWIGFIAGIFPFIYAAYEFWKRIDTQQRCAVCQGTGLVSFTKAGRSLRTQRKCWNCGGLVPWAGWRAFWTGTFDVGNGGVLQRPAQDYEEVSEQVQRRRNQGMAPISAREDLED